MKMFLKRLIPLAIQKHWANSSLLFYFRRSLIRTFGRRIESTETAKARPRREHEGFFKCYCVGKGLDIGYGGDLVCPNAQGWDIEHGDAMLLNGVDEDTFDFVYSSHALEHMWNIDIALKNWWRVIRPGGFLLLYVPHRDLYEKKLDLPSRWNIDHKHFFLPEVDEPPATVGLLSQLKRSLGKFELLRLETCSDGFSIADPHRHSNGEYSIEAVLRKPGSKSSVGTQRSR